MTDVERLLPLITEYLPRQRWFAGEVVGSLDVRSIDVVHEGDPMLLWLLLDASPPSGGQGEVATYQLVLGGRSTDGELPDFLHGKERVILGGLDGMVFYDALIDNELAIDVLHLVAADEEVDVARPLVVEQSNSSVIYDERLIMKLFRRIHSEANPDVEVNRVLFEHGYPHAVPEIAVLRRDGADLAVVRKYFVSALDGWHLAHTSLRDLLAGRMPPEECGGDFAPDAHRLGEVTASLHLVLAEAFGVSQPDVDGWVRSFREQLDRIAPDIDVAAVAARFDRVRETSDTGVALRVHGDLHLAQVVQTDAGWFVLDFEGEPARPVAERTLPSSPFKDVAGMMRSFHYAARTALAEWGADVDDELALLAEAWEQRAVRSFVEGYEAVAGIAELLPKTDDDRLALLTAFELDKAVYEVGYERDHRPEWVEIPLAAITRRLQAES